VANDDAEVEELRAVALKNAESILNARRRAERELLAANEALERKTEELLEQREWFQISLSSIGDALITTDVDGKVALLNPVAERMTAWTSAQAERQPLEHVFPPRDTRSRMATRVAAPSLFAGFCWRTTIRTSRIVSPCCCAGGSRSCRDA